MIDTNADKAQHAVALPEPVSRDWRGYWKERPGNCEETDFLRQVDRTIGGKPIDELQMDLTVRAVLSGLELTGDDFLLDVCCGNGLLTKRFSEICRKVVGVDYSEALIRVAQKFHGASNIQYAVSAAGEMTLAKIGGLLANKASICAGLQYFTFEDARTFLAALRKLVDRKARIFFSDIPDFARISAFYDTEARRADYERRKRKGTEAIGTWWERDALIEMLEGFGYKVKCIEQDPRRFTAHYRFDLVAQAKE